MNTQAIILEKEFLIKTRKMLGIADGQPLKAVVYTRVSTEMQPQSALDSQEAVARDFAKLNNIKIVNVYSDRGISGTTDKRPQFQQMIKDVKAKGSDVSAIIVYKLDRFFRNEQLHHVYEYELGKCDVFVWSATEETYKSDMGTRMYKAFTLINNENESVKIRQNVRRGQHHTAKQGKTNGGIAPLGYDINADGKYIINKDEAKIVKKIFEMRNNGISYENMAKELNRFNYTTKIGRNFTKHSFHEILANPKYKGLFVYNRSASVDEAGKRPNRHKYKSDNEMIILKGEIEPIVSEKLWEAVQPKKREKICKNKGKYLLSGMVICPECGGVYQIDTKKGVKYLRHSKGKKDKCVNSVPMSDVEEAVAKRIVNRIFSKANTDYFVEHFRDISKRESKKIQSSISKLNSKISALNIKCDKLVDQLSETTDTTLKDRIKNKLTKLHNEIDEYTKRANTLKKDIPQLPLKKDISNAKKKLKSLILNPDKMVDSKKLLHKTIKCIYIKGDDKKIEINFK